MWPLTSRTCSTSADHIVTDYLCAFAGELHTYEALSSDTLKNVLSALRRLAAVTTLRAWVMGLAPADLFGFKLIFCGGWEAVYIFDASVYACLHNSTLSISVRHRRSEQNEYKVNKAAVGRIGDMLCELWCFRWEQAVLTVCKWTCWSVSTAAFLVTQVNIINRSLRGFSFLYRPCSGENPSPDAPDNTWREALVSTGTAPCWWPACSLHLHLTLFFISRLRPHPPHSVPLQRRTATPHLWALRQNTLSWTPDSTWLRSTLEHSLPPPSLSLCPCSHPSQIWQG